MRRMLLLAAAGLLTALALLTGCGKKETEPQTQSGGHPDEMADTTRLQGAPDTMMMDSAMMGSGHDSM